MPLDLVATTPGLWRDPQWQPGMPGLYALVVGISAYPHLEDGAQPAPDAFGLGQLGASANTAASLFDWLRQDFVHHALPVVWCQLLLSPTAAEKALFDGRGLTHYERADNNALRNAIQRWTGQVPADAEGARQSRSLFFFSGHGVQSNWRALLLPSDYLDPGFGAPQLQNCISTRELQDWMEQCPVAEHLALIDACRNEFSPLASRGASANACFPLLPSSAQVPRTSASLAATSPGKQAYQAPGQPLTLFGQAVLEALRGTAGGGDTRLEFRELVDYVKPRVNALLQQAGGNPMDQTVRPRIEGDDALVVTELVAPMPAPPPMEGAESTALPQVNVPVGQETLRPPVGRRGRPRRQPADVAPVVQAVDTRFDAALAVHESIALDVMQQQFDENHRRMGHEYVSHLWREGTALIALDDGSRIEHALTLRTVARDEASSQVQVDVELAPRRGGVLLVFEGEQYVQRKRLAVALPTDEAGLVPIRLRMDFGRSDGSGWPLLQKLEARIGPSTTNPHYDYLWALTREADLGSLRKAAELADPARLRAAAEDKERGQTAATAGMLLLANAGRIADLQDWTRNLMLWFPLLPDGVVLWAESLRHAVERGVVAPFGVVDPQAAIAEALAGLQQRGLPFFIDSLELAERLLRYALRQTTAGHQHAALKAVQHAIAQLYEVAQPDGHFPVLAAWPRPASQPGEEALSVAELRRLLRFGAGPDKPRGTAARP